MKPSSLPKPSNVAGDSTFRLLLRTIGNVRRILDPFFAKAGISGSQWAILWNLYRAEEDGHALLRVTDLGERLLIRPPSVTGAVDRLVRAGFVLRSNSDHDQRSKLIQLSPAGRRLVETLHAEHDKRVTSLMDVLSAAEQRQLNQLLHRFVTHLDEIQEGTGREPSAQRSSL